MNHKAWVLTTAFVLFAAGVAQADQARSRHTRVELISEVGSIRPGTPFWVALRMEMDEGWHTYWRNPGDSGIATRIEWELPTGFQAGSILWPYPEKIDIPPLSVYAYEDEVFLLTEITPPSTLQTGTIQQIKADAEWLECEVNCLPGEASLTLKLPSRRKCPCRGKSGSRSLPSTAPNFPCGKQAGP